MPVSVSSLQRDLPNSLRSFNVLLKNSNNCPPPFHFWGFFFAAKLLIVVDDRSLFLPCATKPGYAQKALIMSLVAKTIHHPWTSVHLHKLTLLSVKSSSQTNHYSDLQTLYHKISSFSLILQLFSCQCTLLITKLPRVKAVGWRKEEEWHFYTCYLSYIYGVRIFLSQVLERSCTADCIRLVLCVLQLPWWILIWDIGGKSWESFL